MYFSINLIIQNKAPLSVSTMSLLQLFAVITITPLVPRFIISVRQIYDHGVRGRLHVDTKFGAMGQHIDSEDTFMSTIDGQGGGQALEDNVDGSGRIRLKVMGGRARLI